MVSMVSVVDLVSEVRVVGFVNLISLMSAANKKRLCWKLQDTSRPIEQNEKSRHLFKNRGKPPRLPPLWMPLQYHHCKNVGNAFC